jgi:coatomer protein complex subunit epsilon
LIDKHGSTPLLLNGQAASYIGQEKFDEAEAALQEAVEKDPNNVDTLINLIVLSQQTGKPPEVSHSFKVVVGTFIVILIINNYFRFAIVI